MSLGLLDKAVIEWEVERGRPEWPTLEPLRLGMEEFAERSAGIGGSDAHIILSGNAERPRTVAGQARGCGAGGSIGPPAGDARLLDRAVQPPVVREGSR